MLNTHFRYVDDYSFRSVDVEGGSDQLLLNLTFARWDAWNQVFDSRNGHFLEWIDNGATDDYFRTQGTSTRLLFHHGMDSSVGLKTLGAYKGYDARGTGPAADFKMYTQASHVQDILPGLDPEDRSYGLSYRFGVKQRQDETWDFDARTSDFNPQGLPTRQVHQSVVPEVTVTPFPADKTTNDPENISARAMLLEDAYGNKDKDRKSGNGDGADVSTRTSISANKERKDRIAVGLHLRKNRLAIVEGYKS